MAKVFFRRRRRRPKDTEEKQETFKKIDLRDQKMPLMTLDNSWHQLLSEIKTPEIESLEKKLNSLLKEQGKLSTDYIGYTKMKKEMLDKILELTHEAFRNGSEEAAKKVEEQQKMILKINENLEKTEPRLDIIKEEIERTNSELVSESVNLCYHYLTQHKKESNILDEEIQSIRTTLMKKTEEKKVCDKKSERLYLYLHQLVGPDFIEKLDSIFLESSE